MEQVSVQLWSAGLKLDCSEAALGRLRESNDIWGDGVALRHRMQEEGYLFFRGVLDRDLVMEARAEVVRRLAEKGALDPSYPPSEAVSKPGTSHAFDPLLARHNEPLRRLLYEGPMMQFYERFLGGTVRHFDYTWFRCVPGGGRGTYPHCDIVYMGRGTKQLYTSWTPIGDVPYELGGLMILEQSHRKADLLRNYVSRDVDEYCTNRPDAKDIESGAKIWQHPGHLSKNPVSLRQKLGGRWLTAEYCAGDLLAFTMFTVHASLDNRTNRYRLSSDSRYQLASEPVDERWVGDNPVAHGLAGKRGRIC